MVFAEYCPKLPAILFSRVNIVIVGEVWVNTSVMIVFSIGTTNIRFFFSFD